MEALLEKKKNISKKEFLELQDQTEKVFEYVEGEVIEITSMKNTELHTISKILRKFAQTKAYQNQAELFQEVDCWLSENQMRRPDLAYFTREQILEASKGAHPIPAFVIEIISENENGNYIENKILEYQKAGVQIIWCIYPKLKRVKVVRGKEARYYEEGEELNASPVIEDLKIKVSELFEQEELKAKN